MQGDLISRKELIKELQENIKIGFYGEFTDGSDVAFTIKELERVINEQPTAYSVEDVVEELEEHKEDIAGYIDDDIFLGEYRAYRSAIDIVKGGVDNAG